MQVPGEPFPHSNTTTGFSAAASQNNWETALPNDLGVRLPLRHMPLARRRNGGQRVWRRRAPNCSTSSSMPCGKVAGHSRVVDVQKRRSQDDSSCDSRAVAEAKLALVLPNESRTRPGRSRIRLKAADPVARGWWGNPGVSASSLRRIALTILSEPEVAPFPVTYESANFQVAAKVAEQRSRLRRTSPIPRSPLRMQELPHTRWRKSYPH